MKPDKDVDLAGFVEDGPPCLLITIAVVAPFVLILLGLIIYSLFQTALN